MFTRKIAVLCALAVSFAAHADTKRYLVQFKNSATFDQVANHVIQNQRTAPGVMAPLHLMGANATVGQALTHVKLLVISSDDAAAIASLRNHPEVKMVEEEIIHPAPTPIATWSQDEILRKKSGTSAGKDIARPWGIDAVKAPGAWTTTQGQGVRVMVLDTGADYQHPAIAANFEKGQNFSEEGDATDITDTVGHGTHVSGTILATGANKGLVGVAPQAKLLMGKVCTEQGCSSISIANGLDWAVEEKVAVVNMSLGGSFLSQAEAQALDQVEAAGVAVVAASGNDGTSQVGYPAGYKSVTAVGAVDENLQRATFSQYGPQLAVVAPGVDTFSSVPRGTGRAATVAMDLDGKGSNEIKSLPFTGSPVASVDNNEIVDCGLGKPEDFTNVSVSGKIALIARGDIAFGDKVKNAVAAGAVGAIIYNNVDGMLQGTLSSDGSEAAIPAAAIEQSVGLAAKAALANGMAIKASLDVIRTDYAIFEGTSMATPHVTGVVALIRGANPNLTPAQVRDILTSSSTALGPNDQNQYGHGIVNAEAAVAKATSGM
jgi:subtilisin family serine protease